MLLISFSSHILPPGRSGESSRLPRLTEESEVGCRAEKTSDSESKRLSSLFPPLPSSERGRLACFRARDSTQKFSVYGL